jgi:hypothetical protein
MHLFFRISYDACQRMRSESKRGTYALWVLKRNSRVMPFCRGDGSMLSFPEIGPQNCASSPLLKCFLLLLSVMPLT